MTVIPTRDFSEGKFLVFGTAQGHGQEDRVQRLRHADPAPTGSSRSTSAKGDELVRVRMTSGKDDIIMTSSPATPPASARSRRGRWAGPPPASRG